MMELYLLEQLIAFSRQGTLSGAAEKLHISQPALSQSIRYAFTARASSSPRDSGECWMYA